MMKIEEPKYVTAVNTAGSSNTVRAARGGSARALRSVRARAAPRTRIGAYRRAPRAYLHAPDACRARIGAQDKCGQCFEVMCIDGQTRGLNSSRFGADSTSACHAPGKKSVVVQVTDSCPCVYPRNAVSNKQWCWCGAARATPRLAYVLRPLHARALSAYRPPRPRAAAAMCPTSTCRGRCVARASARTAACQ